MTISFSFTYQYIFKEFGEINTRYINFEWRYGYKMHDNKNLSKTHDINNSEIRKMYPKDGADIGIIHGEKIDSNGKKYTKRSKLSHNK